jgi:hypothetical protein
MKQRTAASQTLELELFVAKMFSVVVLYRMSVQCLRICYASRTTY